MGYIAQPEDPKHGLCARNEYSCLGSKVDRSPKNSLQLLIAERVAELRFLASLEGRYFGRVCKMQEPFQGFNQKHQFTDCGKAMA